MRTVKQFLQRLFKRPQVSLLGLLVLIAACAVLIQFVALPAYRRSERENILARITDLKGKWVELEKEPLRRRLMLQGERVDDAFMSDLAKVAHLVPELKQLDLLQTRVTDNGWRALLNRGSNVDHYVLFENAITDAAIAQAQLDYPGSKIEQRRPDPIAAKLAMAPIPPAAIISMVYDRSSDQLLFGSGDGRLHRMNVASDCGRISHQKHGDWVFDISVSPSGKWVATAGGDNMLSIHRSNDLKSIASGNGHSEDVHGVVWLNDARLVTTGDDATLRLSQLESTTDGPASKLAMVASSTAHDKQIPRVIKIDPETVLTVSRDHTMRRWRVGASGFELQQTYTGHRNDCMDASASPNSQELASVSYDGQLILWDTISGKPRAEHQLGKERLFSLYVDWAKRHVVIGSKSSVQLIHLDSGRLLRRMSDQTYVSEIIRCNETLLTSDGFGKIVQRDHATLAPKRRFQLFEGSLNVFSNVGFTLIGG